MSNKQNTNKYTHQNTRLAFMSVAFWGAISSNNLYNDCVWLTTS